ncbi:MAG: hypothetical protein M3268_07365 [Acidobacteriota bacterium]|nr:hypothetical protein [Acidobacteriota bacterium]
MRVRKFLIVIAAALASATALAGVQSAKAAADDKAADQISGDWDVVFTIEGMKVPGTFTLKLDGDKLTGTAFTQHTGPGTLHDGGTFAHGELSFTLDFAKHESIAVAGRLKDGKLSGEFRTEGREGTWEGTKKK